jgi:signal peptidase II
MGYKNLAWLWVSALVFALDQWTKQLAMTHLVPAKPVAVSSFFNLQLSFNPGAAFSFLHRAGGWQRWFFIGFSILMSGAILIWLYRLSRQEKIIRFGLLLILGGALGNLWDRCSLGYVIDFIQLHVNQWYWPTFNVADSAISLGAFLVLLVMLRGDENKPDVNSPSKAFRTHS